MSTATLTAPVLIDRLVPAARWRDAVVVLGGALFVALLAQVQIPLGFTPVPITGQTLGVALTGAALGSRRGPLSLALYLLLGAVGAPFYAGGEAGVANLLGPTAGYLVGFVPAAWIVGRLAERRADRRPWTAFLAFQVGSLAVFALGVTGLALSTGHGIGWALEHGWLPFVPGDLVKTAIAAGLFPGAWRLVERFTRA
jgi:biotin transport system substrate-specific component